MQERGPRILHAGKGVSMTDAGWAEKKADSQTCPQCAEQYGMVDNGDIVHVPSVVRLLHKEHARSVRIVKREIKRLTASIKDDKRGKNDDAAAIHVYALSICNTLLGKLQRSRGGKG